MKGFLLVFSLFGFVLIQSCTNRCCPDEIGVLENSLELPMDSMPTKYWWKQAGDSVLVDFEQYEKDHYFMPSEYNIDCYFYEIPGTATCETMTQVKTYTLIDSVSNYVLQFHYFPFRYNDGPTLKLGTKMKLTLRYPFFKNDIYVFENFYPEDQWSETSTHYNRIKVKSFEYSYEKGLQKLELNEGLVIYAAD
ncbi:MAG: hypothetical protein ACPGLV_07405 [Bacteroidia bacterium]